MSDVWELVRSLFNPWPRTALIVVGSSLVAWWEGAPEIVKWGLPAAYGLLVVNSALGALEAITG